MSQAKIIYQLKITLNDVQPPIWRRIEVPDCSLAKLSAIIQACMGWAGYHLWSFEIAGEEYGEDPEGELEMASARKAKLAEFVRAGIQKFRYVYDFGDNWEHVIQVEKILTAQAGVRYPRCVKGSRACPPEDCGGVYGYGEFLEAIKNPKHKQHQEMREWIGRPFDPEKFDLDEVNHDLVGK